MPPIQQGVFNAAQSPPPDARARPANGRLGARRRVVPHLPAVLQTAAAAVAAWYLAVLLLPSERPAFASIAAVICVGITYGQRRWRALELVGGVVLGISISSLLLYLIGTGPIQIALLVILAMTAALLFRGGELLVNEAAISAILLASLQTTDAGFSADRILEGLIGGGVGLVIASLLLPPDPVAMVSRVAQTVIGKLGRTLEEAAEALAGGDVERAERALEAARGIDDDVDALEAVLPVASDTARFSPTRRGDRDLLLRYAHTMPQVDFAVRNTRVLARLVLRHARGDEAAPEGLPEAVHELAEAVWELGVQYEEPQRQTRLRELALSAAQRATTIAERGPSPLSTQIVGQVRSIAVDLVRAADQLGEPGAPEWSRPDGGAARRRLEQPPEQRDGLLERLVGDPRGRSGRRRRGRRRARPGTRARSGATPAASQARRRSARAPACGVCGSRVPQIISSSPVISSARASEPASASAPSLPSCRPVAYQHAVARTWGRNAARKARCPPVQCPAAPSDPFECSASHPSAASTSASKSATGVASASAWPRTLPSSSKPRTVPAGSMR